MKKKIKDLTQTELRAICEHDKNCQVCRINSLRFCTYRCRCLADLFACPKNIYNQFKNEEVEIPDELFGISEQEEE